MTRNIRKGVGFLVLLIVLIVGFVQPGLAAVGCTLRDPDRDVRRLFPQSTGYKTIFITIKERGGEINEIDDHDP